MIRYLAVILAAGLLCLGLWLPASHTAAQFYRTARADHASCSQLWGTRFANAALGSALAAKESAQPTRPPVDVPTGPTGQAERRLASRMQELAGRLRAMDYMLALDAMATLASYRLATLRYLAPGTALFLLPALIDAAIRRVIRTHEFRRHDPERYAFAIAGTMVMAAALAILCLLPLPLPPLLPLCALIAAVYCLHVAIANYHHSGL